MTNVRFRAVGTILEIVNSYYLDHRSSDQTDHLIRSLTFKVNFSLISRAYPFALFQPNTGNKIIFLMEKLFVPCGPRRYMI